MARLQNNLSQDSKHADNLRRLRSNLWVNSRKGNIKLVLPVEQLEGGGDLGVGKAVEGKVGVLRDRVRVVDA